MQESKKEFAEYEFGRRKSGTIAKSRRERDRD